MEVSAKENKNVAKVFEVLTDKVIARVGSEEKAKDVLKYPLGKKEEKKNDDCC